MGELNEEQGMNVVSKDYKLCASTQEVKLNKPALSRDKVTIELKELNDVRSKQVEG